jgi:hypothetical protein
MKNNNNFINCKLKITHKEKSAWIFKLGLVPIALGIHKDLPCRCQVKTIK